MHVRPPAMPRAVAPRDHLQRWYMYTYIIISEPNDIFSFNMILFAAIDAEFTGLYTTDGSQPRYHIMNIDPSLCISSRENVKNNIWSRSGPKKKERAGFRSNVRLWKSWWHCGESTCLPPMFCGFKSRHLRHMWAEFVVGSFLCSERFFSGFFSFPLPYMLPNLNFIWNALTYAKQFLHVIVLGPIIS